jgi:SAM-dependent methyltransferase
VSQLVRSSAYDRLADIYEAWSSSDPASALCWRFYNRFCVGRSGTIVELGIGLGHIALELAAQGHVVIGIDNSARMLECCRERAAFRKLLNSLTLLHQDIRDLVLPETVPTVILPFNTIGHLIGDEDRIRTFERVHASLAPGGVFVFDHYIFNREWAEAVNRIPRLVYEGATADGSRLLIWDTYSYSFDRGQMDCSILIEHVDQSGMAIKRHHAYFPLMWTLPNQVEDLARRTNFQVQDVFGGYDGEALSASSKNQVWVLRKPE